MLVKVCGMREPENIRAAEKCDIDLMGFIFAPRSPRCVTQMPAYLPEKVRRIGVFVDADKATIEHRIADYGLYGVQLHGHESPELCRALRASGVKVIKAFQMQDRTSAAQCRAYESVCDWFLFDTPCATDGGSGKKFDWTLLESYRGSTPFLLSGGLSPDCLTELRGFSHPQWAGIDLNSGFETAPALKDIDKLRNFITLFRNEIKNK